MPLETASSSFRRTHPTDTNVSTDPNVWAQYDPDKMDYWRWLELGRPSRDRNGREIDNGGRVIGPGQGFSNQYTDPRSPNYQGEGSVNNFLQQFASRHPQFTPDSRLGGLFNTMDPQDFQNYSPQDQQLIRSIMDQYGYKPAWLQNLGVPGITPRTPNPGGQNIAGEGSWPGGVQPAQPTSGQPVIPATNKPKVVGDMGTPMYGGARPAEQPFENQFDAANSNLYGLSKNLGNRAGQSSVFGSRSPNVFGGNQSPRGYRGY